MKDKDILILSYFRQDARMKLTDVSRKTNVAISTICDKMKEFDNDLVKKHTAIINFSSIGFPTRAVVILKADREKKGEMTQFLEKHPNVNNMFKINNGYDYMIELVFRNIKDIEEFLEKVETKYRIKEKQVYYIIDDIVREQFMSNPDLISMY